MQLLQQPDNLWTWTTWFKINSSTLCHSQVQSNNFKQQHGEGRTEWNLNHKLIKVKSYHRCPVNHRLQKSLERGRRPREFNKRRRLKFTHAYCFTSTHAIFNKIIYNHKSKMHRWHGWSRRKGMFFQSWEYKSIYITLSGKRWGRYVRNIRASEALK